MQVINTLGIIILTVIQMTSLLAALVTLAARACQVAHVIALHLTGAPEIGGMRNQDRYIVIEVSVATAAKARVQILVLTLPDRGKAASIPKDILVRNPRSPRDLLMMVAVNRASIVKAQPSATSSRSRGSLRSSS